MSSRFMYLFSIISLLVFLSCQPRASYPTITAYTFKSKPDLLFELDSDLREVSGLAMHGNRLFAHNDESATLFEINSEDGSIVKQFYVGEETGIKGDFEGLAIVDSVFYLLKSNGNLLEFSEGNNGETVSFEEYKNKLSKKLDMEGLCYDPQGDRLLMITKDDQRKKSKNKRSIFSFSLSEKSINTSAIYLLEVPEIASVNFIEKDFGPSAIEFDPTTDHFFIIAHISKLIVEMDKLGQIIAIDKLPHHPQPEGITLLSDGSIVIADEGKNQSGRLSIYRKSGN